MSDQYLIKFGRRLKISKILESTSEKSTAKVLKFWSRRPNLIRNWLTKFWKFGSWCPIQIESRNSYFVDANSHVVKVRVQLNYEAPQYCESLPPDADPLRNWRSTRTELGLHSVFPTLRQGKLKDAVKNKFPSCTLYITVWHAVTTTTSPPFYTPEILESICS